VKERDKARTFGQDLMRGEHVVGGSARMKQPANGHLDEKTQRALGFYASYNGAEAIGRGSGGATGTSIFDPVLCELVYRWFCPPGGTVLDPFAGGSVRGIVAAMLGRKYVGVELRPEQAAANEAQLGIISAAGGTAAWRCGDARALDSIAADIEADLVFSCPPYGSLERYSDDPADLSTLDDAAFDAAYAECVDLAVARLKPDRFACFVVGDYRDSKGLYRNFPARTVAAFETAGARLYNEAVLITAVGSLPIRTGKQFASGRKLGKTHQNVLVFVKGDWRKAAEACGEVDVVMPGEMPGDDTADGVEELA
jgi:hypothetical protein